MTFRLAKAKAKYIEKSGVAQYCKIVETRWTLIVAF